ncbi:MAG: peptidoglycan DD-metalloendopeptidase family protein [Desulfuromonas sp.]|nr:peptidoglycan DD-metalloendopeptidase family protein [Desulfuromonas sp.]
MLSKIHIIVAADDGGAHSVALSKKKLSTLVFLAVLLVVVAVASFVYSAYTLALHHERKQHLDTLLSKVHSLEVQNSDLLVQVDQQQREKQQLMSETLSHLNERTAQLESILTKVGVALPDDPDGEDDVTASDDSKAVANSGGPFISVGEYSYELTEDHDEADNILDHSERLLDLFAHVPLGRPTAGYCSSGFGRRIDPINGRRAFHSGMDIANYAGTKVYATADGVVVSCGAVNGYGKMVKVKNGQRFSTVFGHLQKILVANGTQVVRGDVIGTMGNTGRSTGPHLHYEIRDHGHAVNPYPFTFL